MSSEPLVSIVIPCFRGERFLADAIGSCLRQTHRNLEILVVDDASPDRCAEIAETFATRDPRVRVLRRAENGGVAAAFNDGFRAARGEFMTRLAQDDLFAPEAVAWMIETLRAHPEAGLVYCDEQQVNERGEVVRHFQKPGPDALLATGNKAGLCVMWRREVWEKTGAFDPRFDAAEDYDYWQRASRRFRFAHCEKGVALTQRMHEAMGTREFSARQEIAAARVRARDAAGALARRRILADGFFNAAWNELERGRKGEALRHLARAWTCWPLDARIYKTCARLLFARH